MSAVKMNTNIYKKTKSEKHLQCSRPLPTGGLKHAVQSDSKKVYTH